MTQSLESSVFLCDWDPETSSNSLLPHMVCSICGRMDINIDDSLIIVVHEDGEQITYTVCSDQCRNLLATNIMSNNKII